MCRKEYHETLGCLIRSHAGAIDAIGIKQTVGELAYRKHAIAAACFRDAELAIRKGLCNLDGSAYKVYASIEEQGSHRFSSL